jgi:TM2 domain-containing membrane protein YozV
MRHTDGMSKALVKAGDNHVRGIIAGAASAFLPGLGQLLNGQTDKAIGVGVTCLVAGAVSWLGLPLIGAAASVVGGLTWIYGVADGYVSGKRKP